MKLTIDNLDGSGPRDYTGAVDATRAPKLVRKFNEPAELQVSLVATGIDFVIPVNGARIMVGRINGQDVFTGYLIAAPRFEYLGWGPVGPIYRYNLLARSDETVLDGKRLPNRSPFVDRSAGHALRQMTEDLLPGIFDTTCVEDLDVIPWYWCDAQKEWSTHAAAIARQARGVYRAMSGALRFQPVGTTVHVIDESDETFSPEGLTLGPVDELVNDLTVIGRMEPQSYVKDYFVGDGYSLRFYMSQPPFTRSNRTLIDEEFGTLDATRWQVTDPAGAVSAQGGKLQVEGGTGVDGQTTVQFVELMELGGGLILQHGDVTFSAASNGILGGLYPAAVAATGCLAGFQITPSGSQSKIQALINGSVTGATITTLANHHYVFTTRMYAPEVYRRTQVFHSSEHEAGAMQGGHAIAADIRLVLEVHDIDPANPASIVAPSTVLFDDVIANGPGFCTYALVNSKSLTGSIAFTRIIQAVDVEVRTTIPGQSGRTRLVGSLADGAECLISLDPALQFFAQTMPVPNELIQVQYRGRGRAMTRVLDPVSVAAHSHGGDNGVRGAVKQVLSPAPRTAADCEQAALALLEDTTRAAWKGEYRVWSDFLPGGAEDIFPGDAVDVRATSRGAMFRGVVREVEIEISDLVGEHSRYTIRFANDAAESCGFAFEPGHSADLDIVETTVAEAGTEFLADLTTAEITAVTSTSVTLDAGVTPASGGGIEVRRTNYGWGADNDRNLVGRFGSQSFTVPRLARVQDFYLRQYDHSNPPKYSRYSSVLHLDYPL